jgi:hypothetical protein
MGCEGDAKPQGLRVILQLCFEGRHAARPIYNGETTLDWPSSPRAKIEPSWLHALDSTIRLLTLKTSSAPLRRSSLALTLSRRT